jgi:hypothetical protein
MSVDLLLKIISTERFFFYFFPTEVNNKKKIPAVSRGRKRSSALQSRVVTVGEFDFFGTSRAPAMAQQQQKNRSARFVWNWEQGGV